jgi:CBS domain-containing protein
MSQKTSPAGGGPEQDAADMARLYSGLGEDPASLLEEIARASDTAALATCYARTRRMALAGVEADAPILPLGRLISDSNDRIMAQAAGIAAQAADISPGEVCLMVLGSEGRREQFFATDQDNALIVAAGIEPIGEAAVTAFSEAFIAMITAIGFPPCPNRVMIDNPQWRLPLSEWMQRADDVVRQPDGPGILMLSLLADARPVFGDAPLCDALAAHLRRRVADSPVTLGYMAREALRFPSPLGFFNTLAVERSGPDKGGLDIKKGGIFAVVQGLRTMALERLVTVTGTVERLSALAELGIMTASWAGKLAQAYVFLQTLRVRFQAQAIRQGRSAANMVFPEAMDDALRERLRDSLREVAELKQQLYARYGLHLFP